MKQLTLTAPNLTPEERAAYRAALVEMFARAYAARLNSGSTPPMGEQATEERPIAKAA